MWTEQNGQCHYCGGEAWLFAEMMVRGGKAALRRRFGDRYRVYRASREHLLRKTDGGSGLKNNMVMACDGCNTRRGRLSPHEYRELVRRQIAAGTHWRQVDGLSTPKHDGPNGRGRNVGEEPPEACPQQ